MQLTVQREVTNTSGTLGRLLKDGAFYGYTKELPVGDGFPGTAIPVGKYSVALWNSPHFARVMPLLLGVPGRSTVEICWFVDPADTRGCIVVGETCDVQRMEVYNTREKFDELFPAIEAADQNDGAWIVIQKIAAQESAGLGYDDLPPPPTPPTPPPSPKTPVAGWLRKRR